MSSAPLDLLILLDDWAAANPATDTSLALIEAAVDRGHRVNVCRAEDIWVEGATPYVQPHQVLAAAPYANPRCEPAAATSLAVFDSIVVRKDGPFDLAYAELAQTLELVRKGPLIVNDPKALALAGTKLHALAFAHLMPRTIVTRSVQRLREFLTDNDGHMVVKPLAGAGGDGVFHVRADDDNTGSILETVTAGGRRLALCQQYVPAVRDGDKRILLLAGEPLGAVLRVPPIGEARANLHAGGTAVLTAPTQRELEISAEVGAYCRAVGLNFVGLDFIGEQLTELNVMSPTTIREINRLEGREGPAGLHHLVIEWLERACDERAGLYTDASASNR